MTVEVWVWARDEDHALELVGGGATKEFKSKLQAADGYDPEVDEGRKVFRVLAEEA